MTNGLLRELEADISKNKRNMWVFLIAGGLVCIIFVPFFTDIIANTESVRRGSEGQQLMGAFFSALIYVIPLIPFGMCLSKNKKLRVQYESIKKQQDASKYNEPPAVWKKPVEVENDKEYVASDVPKTEEPKKAESKETGSSSVKEQLKELKSLYDEKLISKAVYDQKQKDIIDKM